MAAAKVIMLGQERVGKTSMALRFTQNDYHEDQPSTINATSFEKQVNLPNMKSVTLQIWDTAG